MPRIVLQSFLCQALRCMSRLAVHHLGDHLRAIAQHRVDKLSFTHGYMTLFSALNLLVCGSKTCTEFLPGPPKAASISPSMLALAGEWRHRCTTTTLKSHGSVRILVVLDEALFVFEVFSLSVLGCQLFKPVVSLLFIADPFGKNLQSMILGQCWCSLWQLYVAQCVVYSWNSVGFNLSKSYYATCSTMILLLLLCCTPTRYRWVNPLAPRYRCLRCDIC